MRNLAHYVPGRSVTSPICPYPGPYPRVVSLKTASGGTDTMGQLSETQIKAIKPSPKEFFLNDGDNLFLRVRDTGKAWVFRYEKGGKTIKLGLGPYPAVTLAQARAKAYEANSLRADGQDLKEVRRQRDEQARVAQLNTFERLSRTWHASAKKDREWSDGYAETVIRHLEIHVFPWIGFTFPMGPAGHRATFSRCRADDRTKTFAPLRCRRRGTRLSPRRRARAHRPNSSIANHPRLGRSVGRAIVRAPATQAAFDTGRNSVVEGSA